MFRITNPLINVTFYLICLFAYFLISPEVTVAQSPLSINASNTINPFNEEMLGMAMANWEHAWGKPFPNEVPGLAQAFKAANIKLLRYAGGLWANWVGWDRVNQRRPYTEWTKNGNTYAFHYGTDEIDSLAAFAQAIDAAVMVQVNVSMNDPAMWADMVRYTNIEKNYRLSNGDPVFKYWELGNELDLEYENGNSTVTTSQYAQRVNAYTNALKAVDSQINIIGGVAAGAVGGTLDSASNTYFDGYILRAAETNAPDSISYHWYSQCNSTGTAALTDMMRWTWDSLNGVGVTHPDYWRHNYARLWSKLGPTDLIATLNKQSTKQYPLGITELNFDACDFGVAPQNANHANAVWASDILGRLAYNGIDYVTWYQGYGAADQGYPAVASVPNSDNPTGVRLRPSYYTFYMYANYFGDQMVFTSSPDEKNVSIWASTDSDDPGKLKVMVTNLTSSTVTTPINISGLTAQSAQIYQMTSTNPTSMTNSSHDQHTTTINGVKLNDMNVAQSKASIQPINRSVTNNSLTYTFQPYSVTAIVFSGESGSTNPPPSDPFDIQPTSGDGDVDYLDLQAWINRIGNKVATIFDFNQVVSLLVN